MSYHPLTEKITTLLKDRGMWFETFEHEAVRTSEEASQVRTGYVLDQGAKALIVRVKKAGEGKSFAMIVVRGSKKFDKEKLKSELGLSDVRFATDAEAKEITEGVEFGGIPPLGNLFGLQVYVDRGLLDNEKIIFNAGDRSFSVGMKVSDWQSIVNPIVGDIV
jgi:Ala-tRNA(Pro) deacylase